MRLVGKVPRKGIHHPRLADAAFALNDDDLAFATSGEIPPDAAHSAATRLCVSRPNASLTLADAIPVTDSADPERSTRHTPPASTSA
ncbi:MAG: hypothetical protein ABI190_12330 [Casimicrobiaceae bacterium]